VPRAEGLAVALLHYTAPPVVGGVEQVLGHQARLLADDGHQVRVVAGRGASTDPRIREVRVARADTLHPDVVAVQAELDRGIVPPSFEALAGSLAADLAGALEGVDVVIAHNIASLDLNLALTAALHALVAGSRPPRTILWHHDLAWLRPGRGLPAGRPWELLRTPWPGATNVTISEARRTQLVGLLGLDPAAVAVVPNGIDLAATLGLGHATASLVAAGGLAAFDPLLLLPARVTPRKNVALAIRTIAAMHRMGRAAAGLVVTGPADPHDPTAVRHLAELVRLRGDLGLDRSVVLLAESGEAPPAEEVVHDLYRLADALLLPSLDEGFGLPILEAGVHRLPIVCSDLPALRDLAGDAAVYADPGIDPGSLASLVLARLDSDRAAGLARRVRSELTWEAVYRRAIAPLVAR